MTRARDLADGKRLTNVDSNTLVVDADNNRVGVGVASPSVKFELNNGGAGSLMTLTDGVNTNFNFTTSSLLGTFGTDAGSTSLALKTSGSEKMRIDNNGKVGINTTAPNLQTSINFDSSALAGLGIHDTNSGNLGGMLQFYSGSGQGTLRANIMNANNAGVHAALGTGGTVVFGGTSYVAANALDDYEEGTFTPTLSSSFYAGTLTIEGFYRKIGSMVFVQVGARATTSISLTGSGSSYISNMPFAMENHGSIGTYYTASWSNAYTGGTFGNALAAYGNLYSGQTISMGANQAVNVAAIYFTTA